MYVTSIRIYALTPHGRAYMAHATRGFITISACLVAALCRPLSGATINCRQHDVPFYLPPSMSGRVDVQITVALLCLA
jgi:hypothetical protein